MSEIVIKIPAGYTWAAVLNEGQSLDLAWKKHGDEWIDFVFRRLSTRLGSTGYQMASHNEAPGGYIYQASGTRMRSALWILLPDNKGPICIVIDRGPREDSDLEAWRDAVAHALSQIGTVTDFEWWAIIGPDPNSSYTSAVRLSSSAEVGAMKLDPAPEGYAENSVSRFSIFSASRSYSGLVKVCGRSTGYTWAIAAEEGSRRLRLLCAMLSVGTEASWIQRSPVNPRSHVARAEQDEPSDGGEIELPIRSPWDRDDPMFLTEELELKEISIPDWIFSRWDEIALDVNLRSTLINFHEGLTMMPFHPSYAALAFVAVIEALGNRATKKLPHCSECRLVTGSGQRFREALARVLPAEEAENLGREFYDRRSRTAHDGILHGAEPIFGMLSHWGAISENPIRDFDSLLHKLWVVARRLLLVDAGQIDVPKSSLLPPPLDSLVAANINS